MQIMPLEFAKEQANQLLRLSEEEVSSTMVVEEIEPMEQTNMYHENQVKQAPVHEEPQYIGNPVDKHHAVIQEAAFSDLTQAELNNSEKRNLDMLLDIPLKVTVELGRTNRTIKDILDLTSGSIVELDKLAGEPVDILVNEKLIAKGEVVVIDENFGVRVTDIVSQIDRLKNLK
ncbi:flagellar motor switch protein FliN [Paracerasibacillus soli]|uniref:Flagellar motor switch protein FliN n=2 Tax=Paracerasibacillus soli TaxID=480284 RepID=A0ABU5CP81_9BACI|nr:flagellar motor switch protein FliN [Virgibacillus soli]MDY0408171.1 flagellar motor switch protein FliN [Virgibacillus soli]